MKQHRTLTLASFALLTALTLAACTDKPKTSDEDIKQVQYKQVLELLEHHQTTKNVFSFLDKSKKGPTVLLDARPPARYDTGHLPGAINIPLPKILEGDPQLAEASAIIVYGSGWTDYISPATAKRLMALGYHNVYDFRGGVELWKAEGGNVESSQPATQPKP
jgi:rhodanese-related sulfurtransferase